MSTPLRITLTQNTYRSIELYKKTLVLGNSLVKVIVIQNNDTIILSILSECKYTNKEESNKFHLQL